MKLTAQSDLGISNLVLQIISYESGDMRFDEQVDFISSLVTTGTIGHLQGSYGRTAASLLDAGILNADGTVNADAMDCIDI